MVLTLFSIFFFKITGAAPPGACGGVSPGQNTQIKAAAERQDLEAY